ncbi:hypothetical protein GCM10009753_71880 [Streptantibioticus ferralitis]
MSCPASTWHGWPCASAATSLIGAWSRACAPSTAPARACPARAPTASDSARTGVGTGGTPWAGGPPRGNCECGARIFLVGRALVDGLCRLCRQEAEDLAEAADAPASLSPVPCPGGDGVPCERLPLPTRTVCARHRAEQLAAEPQAC